MEATTTLEKITAIVNEIIDHSAYFITDLYIKPTNNIKIFLDGDQAISINVISKLNRAIYNAMEEQGLYPDGDFSLEVSSPGVDTPLKNERQFPKHIGRLLEVTNKNGEKITGKFISLENNIITLEEIINKKKNETKTHTINMDDVEQAIVQIQF